MVMFPHLGCIYFCGMHTQDKIRQDSNVHRCCFYMVRVKDIQFVAQSSVQIKAIMGIPLAAPRLQQVLALCNTVCTWSWFRSWLLSCALVKLDSRIIEQPVCSETMKGSCMYLDNMVGKHLDQTFSPETWSKGSGPFTKISLQLPLYANQQWTFYNILIL